MNGYPFLDNKDEYPYSTLASQIMRSDLRVIEQNKMSVGELETLIRETNFNGYPVVVSDEENFVVGFVTRFFFFK